ncbi:hypothetical protein EDB86DRAFT_3243661 [Lactarius hatsudake]|nr:hypothetical protein EDB86DRAFT_3243661 [Lactarius hatsudake]
MPCMTLGQDPNIRIESYKAIICMSEEQPRWLEWNMQLPQIDEPEEVTVIKMPPEALVVAFLAQDPRKPVLAQLQGQRRGAAEQEDAPIDTLIKAVSKSSAADAAKIIEDILVFLPSFNDGWPTWRENELVLLLSTRVRYLSAQGGHHPWAERGKPGAVPRRHRSGVAPALQLYVLSQGENVTRRLSQDSRVFFVARLIGTLVACSLQKGPESSELTSMRRLVVDTLSLIQPPPSPSPPPDIKELVDASLPSKRKAGQEEPGLPQEQNGIQKPSIRGQHSFPRYHHPKDVASSSFPQQSVGSGTSTPAEAADDGDRLQQSSMTTTTKRLKVAGRGEAMDVTADGTSTPSTGGGSVANKG